ncbi:MAG: hypothetical protein JXA50_00325 [Deltaproteobacteria bacterium]|nr:hypothetical protein [Deltaproteobacteria bacterium]
MINKTRILLSLKSEFKSFFFVQPAKDGSIYFGSSHKKPKEVIVGTVKLDNNDSIKRIIIENGELIEPNISKYSYHTSYNSDKATFHHKNSSGKYIFQFNVARLDDIDYYLCLCTIIPKNPVNFPTFNKNRITDNDIIIPIDHFHGEPFVCEILLTKKGVSDESIRKSDYLINIIGHCSGQYSDLMINLFRKKEFLHWPDYNIIISSKSCSRVNVINNT